MKPGYAILSVISLMALCAACRKKDSAATVVIPAIDTPAKPVQIISYPYRCAYTGNATIIFSEMNASGGGPDPDDSSCKVTFILTYLNPKAIIITSTRPVWLDGISAVSNINDTFAYSSDMNVYQTDSCTFVLQANTLIANWNNYSDLPFGFLLNNTGKYIGTLE